MPLLQVRHVSKSFPGVKALEDVSLVLHAGEGLAIVGENGAGKSTLMKILAGICTPDAGDILLHDQPIRLGHVREALQHGISLIHQELNLAENLSIAANLFLGRERLRGGFLLRNGAMERAAEILLRRVGLACAPRTPVHQLAPGQRQMVEIARALSMQVHILIMDEPTSSLTQRETDRLYEVIDELKRQGVAILYISHRLAEVQRVADRVVVLRDGRHAGELRRAEPPGITHAALVRLMVGRELNQFFQRQHLAQPGRVRLEVQDFRYLGVPGRPEGQSAPIALRVHAGEILGLAGLVGAGRTEFAEALFGLRPTVGGAVLLDGQPVRIRSPRDAIAAGLALVPEDRRYHGLVGSDTVEHNISLPNLERLQRFGLVERTREHALAQEYCDRLHVRTPSIRQTVGLLSGGNQQKVVLSKWLARQPRVLIFDEPTRGIDVGAKSEIYALMDQLAGAGVAIIMISSDLEEILGMSDRVAVLYEGRVAGTLQRAELSEAAIMHLATGGAHTS